MLKGASGDHPAQLCCSSRLSEGCPAACLFLCPCRLLLLLGKLLHCSTTLTLREFLDVQWRIMCFCLCPLPHVLPRAPTAKSLVPPSSWACLVLGYNLAKCQSAWHTGLICSSTPEAHPCHRPAGLT